jgi:chemotaxis protein MotB
MGIARVLLGMLLLTSFLPGCCGKYLREIENQEKLLSVKQSTIYELETKQRQLQAKLIQNDTLMKQLQAKLREDDALMNKLEEEIGTLEDNNQILVQRIKDKLFITLPNAILFSSGSANLSDQGFKTLKTICQVLEKYPDRPICIEGHTDDVPIAPASKEKYATNWELSIARAIQVMNYMVGHFKIKQEILSVKGHGPFKPIASNATPEGRAENRRVVIAVSPQTN